MYFVTLFKIALVNICRQAFVREFKELTNISNLLNGKFFLDCHHYLFYWLLLFLVLFMVDLFSLIERHCSYQILQMFNLGIISCSQHSLFQHQYHQKMYLSLSLSPSPSPTYLHLSLHCFFSSNTFSSQSIGSTKYILFSQKIPYCNIVTVASTSCIAQ